MPVKVAVGDVLAGKYRVERILGSGGMGVVVAARHAQLDVLVALKFMTDDAVADPDLVARFLREARAAARLRSEHVARVTDVGVLESGAPYQVMEYLEGSDLSVILAQQGPQPVTDAVGYIVQVCEALDEAHRAGIVHRDIKPSNLFLTKRVNGTPCVKVLDFGISKSDTLGRSLQQLNATHSRAVLGSPFYMSPEQMRASRDVDARADIWGIGASLYQLLTGHVPFRGGTLLDLALKVAHSAPPAMREARSDVPPALEEIVLKCLEKDREHRYPSAASLAAALEPFAPIPDATLQRTLTRAMAEGAAGSELRQRGLAVSDATREKSAPEVARAPETTLPLPTIAATESAPRDWRTAEKVSWGRSHKTAGGRARIVFGIGALLLLGLAAEAVFLAARRERQAPAAVTDKTPAGSESASSPLPDLPSPGAAATATATTSAGPRDDGGLRRAPAPATSIPVVSVTDIPPARRPIAVPAALSKPAAPHSPAAPASADAALATPAVPARARPAPLPASTPDPLANPN